jgi:hypothetical protein
MHNVSPPAGAMPTQRQRLAACAVTAKVACWSTYSRHAAKHVVCSAQLLAAAEQQTPNQTMPNLRVEGST